MRPLFLALAAFVTLGCGGSPTSPLPPSPAPIPAPTFQAVGSVTFPPTCGPSGCSYSFEIQNSGPGCGQRVRGVMVLVNASGQEIGTGPWELPVSEVMTPQERHPVTGCCVADSLVNQAVTVRIRFESETVRC